MSSQSQSFSVYRGEDASVVLTGADNTNPTGWALLVTVKEFPETAVVLSTTSVTVGGSGPYTLTFSFTRAQTSALPKAVYAIDIWRTDTGSNVRLAGGKLNVLTPVRSPA
jgi:hypothetical protein